MRRARRDRLARFVVAKELALQPEQLSVALDRVSSAHALLDSINAIHLIPDP